MATIKPNIEQIELEFLIQVLREVYGFDFTEYRQAYILRRLKRRMELDSFDTITSVTNEIIHNKEFTKRFVDDLYINVTTMFRYPAFFNSLKNEVFPMLQTYPSIKIWVAGCATGEEVLSLAILLKENNLYDKTTIYATDINESAIEIAKKAIYSTNNAKIWTQHYNEIGGKNSFALYYDVNYKYIRFNKSLLENVTYDVHDLTKEHYPSKFHLIICRNVLIYFNKTLQDKVISKFVQSLYPHGFIGLGDKERVTNIKIKCLNNRTKVYQK